MFYVAKVEYFIRIFFFFQAEDGIRDYKVTGVQTCALPILVGVVSDLLDPDRSIALAEKNRADQEVLREQHASKQRRPMLTLEQARLNRERVVFADVPVPLFTGVRVVEPGIAELREMIDWQFLFLAWQLRGKYPAILEQPVARELFDDANTLLDQIIAEGSF